jgi:hypothetical protein
MVAEIGRSMLRPYKDESSGLKARATAGVRNPPGFSRFRLSSSSRKMYGLCGVCLPSLLA